MRGAGALPTAQRSARPHHRTSAATSRRSAPCTSAASRLPSSSVVGASRSSAGARQHGQTRCSPPAAHPGVPRSSDLADRRGARPASRARPDVLVSAPHSPLGHGRDRASAARFGRALSPGRRDRGRGGDGLGASRSSVVHPAHPDRRARAFSRGPGCCHRDVVERACRGRGGKALVGHGRSRRQDRGRRVSGSTSAPTNGRHDWTTSTSTPSRRATGS